MAPKVPCPHSRSLCVSPDAAKGLCRSRGRACRAARAVNFHGWGSRRETRWGLRAAARPDESREPQLYCIASGRPALLPPGRRWPCFQPFTWFSVGWMMWNWMVSALATGAAVVLYDGSPLVPTPNVLWDLVDRIGITILGTGAKWLSVLEEKDVKPGKRASQGVRSLSHQPRKSDPPCYLVPASQAEGVGFGSDLSVILALVETHSLQTLHTILSTGSPLKAQSYDYVYRCIKSSVLLGSISEPSSPPVQRIPWSSPEPAWWAGVLRSDGRGAVCRAGPAHLGAAVSVRLSACPPAAVPSAPAPIRKQRKRHCCSQRCASLGARGCPELAGHGRERDSPVFMGRAGRYLEVSGGGRQVSTLRICPELILPVAEASKRGTDIMSCFVGQNPSIPVYRGEIQARNLGMAVEVWNEEGKAVWGESGELVCTKPLPCQPTHFWNDENGSKYRKAYFSKFPAPRRTWFWASGVSVDESYVGVMPSEGVCPGSRSGSCPPGVTESLCPPAGVWVHGDYCRINPKTRGIIMLGRSDGTLNPNGVRFGSSEIYNIVEAFKEVLDSLCVPQYNKDGEERVILFLKMASGHTFQPDLVKRVCSAIRLGLSARHVPSLILETQGIPIPVVRTNGALRRGFALCHQAGGGPAQPQGLGAGHGQGHGRGSGHTKGNTSGHLRPCQAGGPGGHDCPDLSRSSSLVTADVLAHPDGRLCLISWVGGYTLNGKKVEMAVKQIIAGKTVEHRRAFSNPETLDLYRDVPELQDF
ncbi:hypothetical protein J1605_012706 [Eschrichtius robustus]|uniref:Acetoacetyl-CoA synthetase n=1 Tax=Eschrichtius robustus TaxID=9764 RepID=A0AB34GII5_ESCRO|nr:hypothetical protein J1605_012706 [Eschrichtius robustus]